MPTTDAVPLIQPRGFPGLPEGWDTRTGALDTKDGAHRLFSLSFEEKDPQNPGRALILFHGFGEHSGRYAHFPHYVSSKVSHLFTYDHRGHGRSEGLRGYIDYFDQFVEDALNFVHRVHHEMIQRYGKAEVHLFGHSMGGLIALRVLRHTLPLKSATICAPLLDLAVPVPAYKKVLGYGLSRIWGTLQMDNELDPKWVSHDPAVVEAYTADRLVHSKATPRFFADLQGIMAETRENHKEFALPVQMILPEEDHIVDPVANQRYGSAACLARVRPYKDYYHEAYNEGGEDPTITKDRPFEDLIEWIEQH